MRQLHRLFLLMILAVSFAGCVGLTGTDLSTRDNDLARLPLVFEPNVGQAAPIYRYVTHEPGLGMGLTTRGIDLFVADSRDGRSTVQLDFDGPAREVSLEPEQLLGSKSNYLRGSDPSRWRTDVPNYARIRYHNLYHGVDLVFYGNGGGVEHDFVVAARADLRQIAFRVTGARRVSLTRAGDLLIGTNGGTLRLKRPLAYQETPQGRGTVRVIYRLRGHRVSFEAGPYDSSLPLVIDPVLVYSTFMGGATGSLSSAIAVDTSGAAYITGLTFAADFPTAFPFQATCRSCPNRPDVFVTKLNPSASGLVYSTFLGGNGYDQAYGIAVDSQGNAIVAGRTDSTNFPTLPPGTATPNRTHGFITSLNASGNGLNWSHYIGGSFDDAASAVALDRSDDVYVTGTTDSPDFPITSGTIPHPTPGYPAVDVFVAKFAVDGVMQFSAILGRDPTVQLFVTMQASSIAVDKHGNAVIAGSAGTNLTTTPGAFQTEPPNPTPYCGPCENGFVAKINRDASAVIFSTYFGGSGGAPIAAMTLDRKANIYITGTTGSIDLPVTSGAFQTSVIPGTIPSFVAALDSTGSSLVYSTYLGATQTSFGNEIDARSIALDSDGNTYVGGTARSSYLPVLNPLRSFPGSSFGSPNAGFITELSSTGDTLLFSSYLSGSVGAEISSIALDARGAVYLTGNAYSNDFPTTEGAYETSVPPPPPFVQMVTPFVTKLDLQTPAPSLCFSRTSFQFRATRVGTTSPPQTSVVTNCGNADLTISEVVASRPFNQANTCVDVLMPGETCTVSAALTPPEVGSFQGTLSLISNAGIPKLTLPLSGAGAIATLEVPSSFVSAPVVVGHSSAPQLLLLRNSGQVEINIQGMTATGDFTVENHCPAVLFPRQFCLGLVTFTPKDVGTRSGVITVQDDATGGPHSLNATGSGLGMFPIPSISSIVPSMVPISTGFQLRVIGMNFFPESVIRVNGVDHATTYQQSTFIYTNVEASDVTGPGYLPITVFNPGPGGGESNAASLVVFRSVHLAANAVVYEPRSQRLFATAGDSVVPIDPTTGETGAPIQVGAGARRISVSNDGHYLYVGIDGENSIRRVDLFTNTADLRFPLGSDSPNLIALDIRVSPTDPDTFIVAVGAGSTSPPEAGINLYRDGVLITRLKHDFSDRDASVDSIAFLSNDGTKVYGFDPYSFSTFTISDLGLTRTSKVSVSYPMGFPIATDARYLYGTSGRVVDPASGAVVFTYPISGFAYSVLPDKGRIYFLDSVGTLQAYDQDRRLLGSLPLPQPGFSLVRWAEDGFALIMPTFDPSQVVVFRSALARP